MAAGARSRLELSVSELRLKWKVKVLETFTGSRDGVAGVRRFLGDINLCITFMSIIVDSFIFRTEK